MRKLSSLPHMIKMFKIWLVKVTMKKDFRMRNPFQHFDLSSDLSPAVSQNVAIKNDVLTLLSHFFSPKGCKNVEVYFALVCCDNL